MRALRSEVSACALAFMLIFGYADADFTADCPTMCDCKWQSGNKAANCSQRELKEVPDKLSSEIQNFDLSNNPLINISPRAFDNVGLCNLKKLWLHDCKLSTIDKDGFSGLSIMIELDLSKNNIKTLHPSTFNETIKLRHLIISENKLERIEDGLFNDLPYLQKIDLRHNSIYKLGTNSFRNLPMLKTIFLENNNLSHVKLDTINKLKSMASLVLHENPWKCDCNLQSFRNWVIDHNLYTQPTACAEPESLRNRLWIELLSEDFACRPKILEPFQGTTIEANGKNITLSCKVIGNPKPEVNWVQNSRILGDDLRKNHFPQRYEIKQTTSHGVSARWTNLTIISIEYKDRGEYTCIAKNPAGVEERTVSLTVNRTPGTTTGNYGGEKTVNMIIWLTVTVAVVFLILVIAFCIYCRRRDDKRPIKSDMHSSNGEALIEGSVVPEMQKSLITTVNPLTKPPRRYDMPSSVTSGATEMSEMSKVLLDNDSVFAPNEDESRSMDFADQLPKRTRETFSVDNSRTDGRAQFPPDLLSFPPRGGQTSPAASSASTAPDSSRLPPQVQAQSPLHSPIYSQNPHLYRSLPYSRSQSPFPSSVCPPVAPRQGYVTIPRRPRVPSWSSASTAPALPTPGVEYVEPVYDNLGLRTTADGSSVLSLNKAGLEQQLSPIMRGRPLPATPGSYQGPPLTLYTNVEEMERAPSPAPSTPYGGGTLPRINGNSMHLQLSPSTAEPQEPRRKNQPETGSLKRFNHNDDNNRQSSTPLGNGRLYDSIDTMGRSGKIPPRPPPKPKKKSPADPNGPLFEDEGEDGTEV